MNSLADEILSYLGISEMSEKDILHYGMPRRSGRYPYGSGENPYQHGRDFLGRIQELKKSGFTYTDENGKTWTGEDAIRKSMGMTTTEWRNQKSWANYERRLLDVETAKRLHEKEGLGATEIGRRMGMSESTVRSLLNPKSEDRMNKAMETVEFLRKQVDEKGMIDVGVGVERDLNISKERLELALDYLQKVDGCNVYGGGIAQPTNKGQQTNQRVLTLPGIENKDIYNYDQVKSISEYISRDGGETYEKKFHYPESMDSKRLMIRYADDKGADGITGIQKDGIVELRRGVADLSLGESRYSQVRILVDGTHYIKGMAVYSDNMPDGVDVIFNTNKTRDKSKMEVLKEIKNDPDNPFGSAIKDADQGGQYWYTDSKTGQKKLGLINKRADEGDWSEWSNALPSQFLGKQSITMAKKQLNLAKADKLAEFDEICALENPTVKKYYLEKFAENCDSAATHLKAAALPGQKYHVIIPINTLKDNEVYAPNYENGTKLALVRYPHGGTFEIPILTVNNRNKLGNEIISKTSTDAVGITSKNAERLSGADFDGDTVMCIPTHDTSGKIKISNRDPLEGLVGFDPKTSYQYDKKTKDADGTEHYYRNGQEFKVMRNTGTEMGVISNLITDMTLGGAKSDELARAVRHSMVVIDAEKHKLDYKASEVENDIASLKNKYQVRIDENGNEKRGGASTILSRAKGEVSVDKRQGSYKINMPGDKDYDPTRPDGAKIWKKADDLYYPDRKYDKATGLTTVRTADGKKVTYDAKNKDEYNKYNPVKKTDPDTGEVVYTSNDGSIIYNTKTRKQQSTRMAETDDAYTLVSKARRPMEVVYADYANDMKSLANQARMEYKNTTKIAYSANAKREYLDEVKSLENKLNDALKNAPRERAALRMANAEIKAKEEANPNMKADDKKKIRQRALAKAREEVGAIRRRDRSIDITDNEWKAIQAGAISETKLKQILNNTDADKLRQLAMPKATNALSTAQVNRIKALGNSNYSLEEIANKLGVSTTTVSKYLKGAK